MMVRDCDQFSLVHDLINLLRYIITPSLVKSFVDDGRSLVVGNTYGGEVLLDLRLYRSQGNL